MIALSIRQPWATLILLQGKDVENRSWPCPAKHIGQTVLIHASSSLVLKEPFRNTIRPNYLKVGSISPREWEAGFNRWWEKVFLRGGIIGAVTITGCIQDSTSKWAEAGHYHWLRAQAPEVPPLQGQAELLQRGLSACTGGSSWHSPHVI